MLQYSSKHTELLYWQPIQTIRYTANMKKDFPKIGPTVTMFVPYDCNNACPFCVNKQEYRDTSGFFP